MKKIVAIGLLFLCLLPNVLAQKKFKIDSLKQILESNANASDQAIILLELGYLLQDSLSNSARKYIDAALVITLQIGDIGLQGDAYNQLGNINRIQGDYVGAVRDYLEALKLSEQIGDQLKIAGSLHNLATAENNQGNLDEAKKYLNRAIKMYNEYGVDSDEIKEKVARSYNSLGIAFKNDKMYDSAFFVYRKGIDLVKDLPNSYEIATLYNSIGYLHDIVDNLDSARYYFEEAYQTNIRLGRTKNQIFSTMHLSRLARWDKDYETSLKYVKEGLALADNGGFKYILGTMYLHLSKTYKGMGILDSAIWSYEQFVPLNDSVVNADYNKQLASLRVDFETEKKEQQIAVLEHEKKSEEIKRLAYAGGLLLSIIIGGLIIFGLRYRIRKNSQLNEKERQWSAEKLNNTQSELDSHMLLLIERSTQLEELNTELERVKKDISGGCPTYNGALDHIMQSTILTNDEWFRFKKLFNQVHPSFFTSMRQTLGHLTETEERLLALTRLNLQTKEVALMLGINADSVNKSRYRLRKKLNINSEQLGELVESF